MKQKLLSTLLCLLLVVALTACDTKTSSTDAATSSTEIIETSNTVETKKDDGKVTIQTKHFSVKVPKEWQTLCSYEIEDMSISFTHKQSNAYFQENYDFEGGFLFSISIEDLSYYCDVEAEILGGLSIPEVGEFNVWKTCASDVQSEGESHNEYVKCLEEMDNIISTISFNEGYYFSETPYAINNNEYYAQNYEQNETQSQLSEQSVQHNYQNESERIIPDWKIKSIVENYCRNELKRELFPKTAATIGIAEIISRSEHSANVRCRFNYADVGNTTNKLYVVVIVDIYTGEILSVNIQ